MGVPISFFGAFLFFDFFGVNFHVITLLALIIVLGIVVDDAVVVGENIIAEQEAGLKGMDAAKAGIKGVAAPVTIGVMTTVAAFAPLGFVSGFFSQFYQAVPIVVITVLMMSLVEAFLILPAHLTHGGNWSRWPLDVIQQNVSTKLASFSRRDRVAPRREGNSISQNHYLNFCGFLFVCNGTHSAEIS